MHPISAGTLTAIGVLGFLGASVLSPPGRKRFLGIPAPCYVAALSVVLLLTNSRGPLFACIAGGVVLLLVQVEVRTRAALVLTGGTFAGAYVAFGPDLTSWFANLANQDTFLSHLLLRNETADTLFSLNGRLDLWDELRSSIAAHPLLGYGYQASRGVVLDAASWAAYAHNALLQTVLDLGIIGTSVLVAIIVTAFVGFARAPRVSWTRATIGALLVFQVLNSIANESFAAAPGFETLLLFVCALGAFAAGRDELELIEL